MLCVLGSKPVPERPEHHALPCCRALSTPTGRTTSRTCTTAAWVCVGVGGGGGGGWGGAAEPPPLLLTSSLAGAPPAPPPRPPVPHAASVITQMTSQSYSSIQSMNLSVSIAVQVKMVQVRGSGEGWGGH